jgi:uncharacterized membrane protein
MSMLVTGLLIWIVVHLFPSVAPARRAAVIDRLGEGPYKGIFSLLLIAALLLIVFGWRGAVPAFVYLPAGALRPVAMLLAVLGMILFVASNMPTRIKRVIRHPQLSGVLLWSIAHLMANGDNRSVALFSAMGAWSVIAMLMINRRDGARVKPEAPGWGQEVAVLVVGLVVSAVVVYFHRYLSGMPLLG